jgi:REP element-mobilizing transposase RayT
MTYSNRPKRAGYLRKSLWAVGYYCGSAGHVSQDAAKRYILEQHGKDVFEYNLFGDPTGINKIGDFTG